MAVEERAELAALQVEGHLFNPKPFDVPGQDGGLHALPNTHSGHTQCRSQASLKVGEMSPEGHLKQNKCQNKLLHGGSSCSTPCLNIDFYCWMIILT